MMTIHLTPFQAWERYVGKQTVAEFLHVSGCSAEAAVENYVADWPFDGAPPAGLMGLLLEHIRATKEKQ